MGLRVSPNHGVNPSVMQCFVCMKDVGVVLFGRLPGDVEAPRKVCLDREPCEECKEWMTKGVILISVDESKSGDLENPYRTGGWVVLTDEAITRMIQPAELRDHILKRRMAFVPDDAWDFMGLPREDSSKI